MLADDSVDSDSEKIQGIWRLVYQESAGRRLPDEKTAEMFHGQMVFTKDKVHYTAELPGFDFEFAYRLNTRQQPPAIDLKLINVSDKNNIGQSYLGIYHLKGDTLEICYGRTNRPVAFESHTGSNNNVLIHLKR
jgi:uncharacterized protein (TIGR03067 family)